MDKSKGKVDPEYNLEDEKEALYVEDKALQPYSDITLQALPTRQFLEKTTIPTVYEALKVLVKVRPTNPVEFFSYYLMTHNPYQQQGGDQSLSEQKQN